MPITIYEITIPVFIRELGILSRLLEKGVAYTKTPDAKISEEGLLQRKLIDDMGGLVFQSTLFLLPLPLSWIVVLCSSLQFLLWDLSAEVGFNRFI